jgi:hypothetical protein
VDAQLAALMAAMGAVVIEGPKACVKTMTAVARRHATPASSMKLLPDDVAA